MTNTVMEVLANIERCRESLFDWESLSRGSSRSHAALVTARFHYGQVAAGVSAVMDSTDNFQAVRVLMGLRSDLERQLLVAEQEEMEGTPSVPSIYLG